MPLRRYQIRNEYGLADPDLYKAADKDDPEALLEGVAMAGLVGVLRQLGDLAEFAAEIFHDLHEEVMATAARGHGLMARVQQLEAEFPSVEKAFLSQTNHTSFFSTTGVGWHPNLRMEQNLVTRGDLPRFVMDSYEESRAPPRLFLLDKFDVAGAGACLKRYTDPSFFKGETASSGLPTVDIQREKKIRKVKKKGSRWRNGETPEIMPTSHAKLHELFLEERVENAHPDPARLVKLKRRQLNGSALDPKTGKSYMEKFLGSPSPEHKAVCDVSVAPPALKLTSDNYSESGLDIHEVSMVSPVKQSLNGKQSFCSSPNVQEEVVRKPYMDELNVETVDRQLVRVSDFMAESEMDDSPSSVQKMEIKEEVTVGVEDKTKGSIDGEHSDDVTSEVDNYMDALTTMDSEMDTDNEYKTKTERSILNVRKDRTDSDANEEQLGIQANLSDSQSIGNSSMSDVRNSLSKKGRFSFSSSDSHSSSTARTPSDGGAACSSRSNRSSVSENMDFASDNLSTAVETKGFESNEVAEAAVIDDAYVEEDKIAYQEESSSSLPDSNTMLLPSLPVGNSMTLSLKGHDSDETPPEHAESSGSVEGHDNVIDLANSSAVNPDVSSLERHDILHTVSSESCLQDKLDNEEPDVSSDAFVQTSNMLEQCPEKRGNSSPLNNLLQTDYSGESCAENLGEEKIEASLSDISSSAEQLSSSASLEVEVESGVILLPDFSGNVKSDVLVSEGDEAIAAEAVNSDGLLSVLDAVGTDSIKEHQLADIATVTSQAELDSVWMGVQCSKEKRKVENISGIGDVDEMDDEFTGKVDAVGGDAIPVEHPSKSAEPGLVDEVSLDNVTAKKGQGEDDYTSVAVAKESTCVSTDLICSPSRSSSGLQRSPVLEVPQQQDLDLDAANGPEHSLGLSQREGKQAASAEGLGSAEDKLEIEETVHDQSLVEEIQTSYTADVSLELSLEVNKNELESGPAFQNQSEKKSEDGVCSPPCNFTEAKTSLEQSMKSQADQLSAEFVHMDILESMSMLDDLLAKTSVEQSMRSQADQLSAEFVHVEIHESTSKLDDLLDSELEVALENSARLQSDPLDGAYLQAVGASPESSSDLHSKQIKADEQRLLAGSLKSCLEELPSQELLLQASCQDLHVTKPAVNPFDSVFPKSGPSAEATHINMEETKEMPPLPPLPPMQWRIGKVQPAPQTELVHHSREIFPPMQPFTNPFLCLNVPDGPEPHHLAADQLGNGSHPNPFSSEFQSTADDENSRQGCLPLEYKPDLTNSTEILNERLVVPSSSPLPATEYKTSGDGHGSLEGPQMQLIDQLVHHKDLEAKTPEGISLNAEREEGHSADKPVLSSMVEQQPQQNSVTYLGETTWPSTSFVLPSTYEIGKSNGNKLPRPRNPLIDAVAAIDKSKLRKVSERARPLVEPKVDERDSLLQQIRTKSFNLKPAAATRPSIQPVQDQKTNLQVAAIIAKANAIRQALAGSDEDDSDSWSDS